MLAHKNIVKDIGRLIFWFPVRWCVQLMSFQFVHILGTLFGTLDYYFSGRQCIERMKVNLIKTLGYRELKADRIIRQNFQNHSRNVLELIKYPQINKNNMLDIVDFEGREYLDKELEKGNGVILLTGHFGAKQILQVGFGLLGYPLTQLNYHMQSQECTWIQKNVSQRQRIRIENSIPVKFVSSQGYLGSVVKAVKKNEILLIAGDGIGIKEHMGKGYKSFPFLGRSMLFPIGGVTLAKRTQASILPVFAMRKRHHHKIVIEPPIDPEFESEDAIKAYISTLEKYIRREPALWEFWEEFEPGLLIPGSD